MTDKQIMIDGVNVGKCRYFLKDTEGQDYDTDEFVKGCCEAKGSCIGYEFAGYGLCRGDKDCYFKQLARKTQECENLKAEEKYLKQCCEKAGEALAKHSFEYDGKEKNLVVQAMELNEKYEKLEKALEEIEQELKEDVYCESQECGCDDLHCATDDRDGTDFDFNIKENNLITKEG